MITIDLSSQEAQIVDLQNIDHISTLPQLHPHSPQLPPAALECYNRLISNGETQSIQQQEYRPESESDVSSQKTLKYKRHQLRLREILAISEDQFYKRGKYSGIYRIKRDQEEMTKQKKEENVEEKYYKKEDGFKVRQKKECILRNRKKEYKDCEQKQKYICKANRLTKLQFKKDISSD